MKQLCIYLECVLLFFLSVSLEIHGAPAPEGEEIIGLHEQSKGLVRTFLSDRIALGGFYEHGTKGIWGPGTQTQVSANSNLFGLNITAFITEDVRFVNQEIFWFLFPLGNPNNNAAHGIPGLTTQRAFSSPFFFTIMAQAYIEYEASRLFRIEVGQGYVPFGIALQQREPVLFLRREGPQLIRQFTEDTIVIASPVWTGVHVSGSQRIADQLMGYDIYSLTPFTNSQVPGAGARAWWDLMDQTTAGLSYQMGKYKTAGFYQALGADLKLEFGRFGVFSEVGYQLRAGTNPWTAYIEPYVKLLNDKLIVHLELDYLNYPTSQTPAGSLTIVDPYEKLEYGIGVNWLPWAFLRFRLRFLIHDYLGSTATPAGQNRDYSEIDASAGIAF